MVRNTPSNAGESESRSVMSDFLRYHGLYSLWSSLGQNTGVGSLSLLQGIFLTQESNWGLLHCRRILYQLSYQGSNAGDMGSIPGLGTKIPHAVKQLCLHAANKELTCFNKDPAQPKLKINKKKREKQNLKKKRMSSPSAQILFIKNTRL